MNIAVDFDGVIHRYSGGWQDGKIYDPPMAGCRVALIELRKRGHKIIIFTTRAHSRVINGEIQHSQLEELIDWLSRYEIPYDEISTEGKPLAHVYLDDRGLRFTSWLKAVVDLTQLEFDNV